MVGTALGVGDGAEAKEGAEEDEVALDEVGMALGVGAGEAAGADCKVEEVVEFDGIP